MKKLIAVFIFTFILSCSATNEPLASSKKVNDLTELQKNQTIVNSGNVSDLNNYPSKPYTKKGAGYQGTDFKNLPKERVITFTHRNQQNVTKELNNIITDLHNIGGGIIYITKGNYTIKEVTLKSNIHIIINSNVTFQMDHSKRGKNFLFNVGMKENQPLVENVKIIGLGDVTSRPKLILDKPKNTFYRAIALGYAKNVLIENLTIQDNLTKGAAIALNPVKIDDNNANIPENITITNVELTGGSIGYGLAQTNVGKNILLKNLSCQGGMTCRIEAHTGRQYNLGVDNIVISNVASINGKAAVLLQPHSVLNGRILVDGAKSEGSTWTLFLKEGFVGKDSKRRAKGVFAPTSSFKNISLHATDHTATLSYKNFKLVPEDLHAFYKTPDFTPITEDANYAVTNGVYANESAVKGASVAAIYTDATYPLQLPKENEILITGKTKHRLKIIDNK